MKALSDSSEISLFFPLRGDNNPSGNSSFVPCSNLVLIPGDIPTLAGLAFSDDDSKNRDEGSVGPKEAHALTGGPSSEGESSKQLRLRSLLRLSEPLASAVEREEGRKGASSGPGSHSSALLLTGGSGSESDVKWRPSQRESKELGSKKGREVIEEHDSDPYLDAPETGLEVIIARKKPKLGSETFMEPSAATRTTSPAPVPFSYAAASGLSSEAVPLGPPAPCESTGNGLGIDWRIGETRHSRKPLYPKRILLPSDCTNVAFAVGNSDPLVKPILGVVVSSSAAEPACPPAESQEGGLSGLGGGAGISFVPESCPEESPGSGAGRLVVVEQGTEEPSSSPPRTVSSLGSDPMQYADLPESGAIHTEVRQVCRDFPIS